MLYSPLPGTCDDTVPKPNRDNPLFAEMLPLFTVPVVVSMVKVPVAEPDARDAPKVKVEIVSAFARLPTANTAKNMGKKNREIRKDLDIAITSLAL